MCCICWDTMGHSDQDHFPVEIANVEGCRGHVFGMKCIVEWLTNGRPMSNTCPMCRTQLIDAHEDTMFLN
ncbi:hypothetical protein BCR34DRAFT_572951 [Clohesyomyces aquaticus]|uniref:RING-type domain-containing protein n=1 Tax=Clohesyomyces aquaticus TaxID=1231657 RepID=A0A1Y1Z1P6_9PLEO|nr:hypothetical protein BCR34DRAFT_572951 [Clohesyomyces aquaticus]